MKRELSVGSCVCFGGVRVVTGGPSIEAPVGWSLAMDMSMSMSMALLEVGFGGPFKA